MQFSLEDKNENLQSLNFLDNQTEHQQHPIHQRSKAQQNSDLQTCTDSVTHQLSCKASNSQFLVEITIEHKESDHKQQQSSTLRARFHIII
jgi:hypothetical protein